MKQALQRGSLAACVVILLVIVIIGSNTLIGRAQGDPTAVPLTGQSLSAQIGFSDPTLDALEARGVNTLGDTLEFEALGKKYRLMAVWSVDAAQSLPLGGAALLYEVSAAPMLVWQFDYAAYNGQAPYLYDLNPFGQTRTIFPPGDWLGAGRIFFAVASVHSGTAWSKYIVHIYEITPNGVQSALKGVIPNGFVVVGIESLGENSGVVLTVADLRGELTMGLPNCCGPRITRYYQWTRESGVPQDASPNYIFNYYTDIGYAVHHLTAEQPLEANDIAARLLELLAVYEALGKRDEGYQLVLALTAQLKRQGALAEGTYVDTIFWPAMQRLYEAGRPFVAPEYVDLDLNAFPDWYDEMPKLPQ